MSVRVMTSRPHSRWRKSVFAKVAARDGMRCVDCGASHRMIWRQAGRWGSYSDGGLYTKVNGSSNLEVDHQTPLHRGGSNDLENLRLRCRDCHRLKTTAEHSARLKALFAEERA